MPCTHPSSEDGWWHSQALMPQLAEPKDATGARECGTGDKRITVPGFSGSWLFRAIPNQGTQCPPGDQGAVPGCPSTAATSLAVYSSSCVLPLARPPPQSQARHFRTCPNSRCQKGIIQLLPLSPACPGASQQSPSPVLLTEGMGAAGRTRHPAPAAGKPQPASLWLSDPSHLLTTKAPMGFPPGNGEAKWCCGCWQRAVPCPCPRTHPALG